MQTVMMIKPKSIFSKRIVLFLSCSILLICCHFQSMAYAEHAYSEEQFFTLGVVPQQSIIKTVRIWAPVLNHIRNETGINIVVRTTESMKEYEEVVDKAHYDFLYSNPYQYIKANEAHGYQAFAKEKNRSLQGILVTAKSAPFKVGNLTQFQDLKIGFPAPTAYAATLLIRAELEKANVQFTPHFAGNHDSSYAGVIRKLWPVGGGVHRTFENHNIARSQLRIIYTTSSYSPHALAYHPRIDHKIRNTVIDTLLSMKIEHFSELQFHNGLIAAQDSDWSDTREIKPILDRLFKEAFSNTESDSEKTP